MSSTFVMVEWAPRSDITAYELALALDYRERLRLTDFKDSLYHEMPENVRRHFRYVAITDK